MCIRDSDMYGNGNKPVIDGNGSYFMPQIKDWKGPFVGEDGSPLDGYVGGDPNNPNT